MQTKRFVVMLMVIFFFAPSLSYSLYQEDNLTVITTKELKRLISKKVSPFLLINSLSPIEFSNERIPGSICIPYEIMRKSKKLPKAKNILLIFYCKGPRCYKSKFAARLALQLGYLKVYWYKGGIKEWKKAGYKTTYTLRLPDIKPEYISLNDFYDIIKKKIDFQLLDIRDSAMRKEKGRIACNQINIPFYDLHNKYIVLSNKKPIVIYDERGLQASTVCKFLKYFKFNFVKILKGGFEAWQRAGYPIQR